MYHTKDEDTIIAHCTPRGSGAIALLRISGVQAVAIADTLALLPRTKKLADQPTHTIHAGWVVDAAGNRIDQVMFLLMRGPRTFTGQDTVEITSHNNQFVVERIIELAIERGARLAQPGEFTRRALQHGKIDLLQAEAIDELVHAQTQQALKKSLAQLEGTFSHWVAELERQLVKTIAWCEASFEFLDGEGDFIKEIREQLAGFSKKLVKIQQSYALHKQVREGVRIALLGSVNVGKSSLFNALLQNKRAIVSPLAGTTRDSIEASLCHDGNYWTLIDTAGLRDTDNVIEKEGIERSLAEAGQADIVLLVVDVSRQFTVQEQAAYDAIVQAHAHKIIFVAHKADMPQQNTYQFAGRVCAVSSATGVGMPALLTVVTGHIEELFKVHESPFLVNKRQHQLLARLAEHVRMLTELCHAPVVQYEIISYRLQDALIELSELTGKTVSEAALDAVFKEFCVGK